jgi:hypothetical protein
MTADTAGRLTRHGRCGCSRGRSIAPTTTIRKSVHLPERTEVEVLIPMQSPSDDDPTGWAAARALIGFIEDAPADMAEHHDHYLYGRPHE